jgi:catechol 2,3-dioxygenase-like lactoylglutathione lyase family enzyme
VTELAALELGDEPAVWERLGFAVQGARCRVGSTELVLTGAGGGIVGWTLRGDGEGPRTPAPEHPNGALKLDHVVLTTPDLEATFAEMEGLGLDLRRVREAGDGRRQGFFRMGETLLEVVGPAGEEAAFWGLVVVVEDLDALAARLGEHLSAPRDAVQPGRRIATARPSAGSGLPLAFMSKRIQ